MADATQQSLNACSPTLQRVWGLIALMAQLLGNPARIGEFQRLCDEAERLLAQCMFECAARIAGRTDLLMTHEAFLVGGRGGFQIRIREKTSALGPLAQSLLALRRSRAANRYRTALGARSRVSSKMSRVRFANQRRRQSIITARRRAGCAIASHTPVRVSAPP